VGAGADDRGGDTDAADEDDEADEGRDGLHGFSGVDVSVR
jgi:hypothetical protein